MVDSNDSDSLILLVDRMTLFEIKIFL
jgi:hypothetical protein